MIGTVCLQCGTPSEQGRGHSAGDAGCHTASHRGPRSSCQPARSATGAWTTTADSRLWIRPVCAWIWCATGPSTIGTPSATTNGWSPCAKGGRIRVGRWTAPFDTVRHYLVTGQIEAGRNRALAHDAIVTAMTQSKRWGTHGDIVGDQPNWKAARAAVTDLMERYAKLRR